MIIQLASNTQPDQRKAITERVAQLGYKVNEVKTQAATYLIGIGKKEFDIGFHWRGVARHHGRTLFD